MGKRLMSQRRGKGSPTFLATKHAIADSRYIPFGREQEEGVLRGRVVRLMADSARSGIMVEIVFENNEKEIVIAADGIAVGQEIQYGKDAELKIGNANQLGELAEGCPIFNVERNPGDGGELARASGGYAIIVTKDRKKIYVKLPSGKTIALNPKCRATIGCAAGGGRVEKPFVKAGNKYFAKKARRKKWPLVRGVAMNAVDHPFGGSQHHPGKSKSTSRNAPPGRKVGQIASSRTGRRKKN